MARPCLGNIRDSARRITQSPTQNTHQESTSSGNADGISGNANTELPSVTPRGTILFFHGGGWTTGGINLYTQACAHMAVRLQRRVISVEYRLAPEYRFPTAVEDCYEVARQLFAGELPISWGGWFC